MTLKEIGNKIAKVAEGFVGQKEIPGNMGWENSEFTKIMEAVGWKPTHAWCAYFGEAVWKLGYVDAPEIVKEIDRLCSGSAVRTLANFKNAGATISDKPVIGALAIWQTSKNGNKKSTGHVGVVVEVHKDHFVTIEGNTNAGGGREGDVVAKRTRKYQFHVYNGLELQGFIYPLTGAQKSAWPFKNKTEGNKFRKWVNQEHPEVAREIDLDPKGSHDNEYIKRAYERLGKLYEEQR